MTLPPPKFIPPPRNPVTHAAHKREVFWQITVPLVVIVFLCAGMSGLVIWSAAVSNPNISRWADVSFIWLTPPVILGLLITLVLVGGLAFGIIKLVQVLPPYARIVQDFFVKVLVKTRQISDQLVAPLIQTKGLAAGARELRKQIGGLVIRRPK